MSSSNFIEFAKEILIAHENYQAESSTARSVPPLISLRCQFTKPWEALALIYISIDYPEWETDILIQTIAHRAYANNYNGRWRTVQAMLEVDLQSTEQFRVEFLKYFSKEEYYGNLLRLVKLMNLRKQEKNLLRKNERTPKYPQRKRGYADKGSRRYPHEHHGQPYAENNREDRRKLVHHPLLRE